MKVNNLKSSFFSHNTGSREYLRERGNTGRNNQDSWHPLFSQGTTDAFYYCVQSSLFLKHFNQESVKFRIWKRKYPTKPPNINMLDDFMSVLLGSFTCPPNCLHSSSTTPSNFSSLRNSTMVCTTCNNTDWESVTLSGRSWLRLPSNFEKHDSETWFF